MSSSIFVTGATGFIGGNLVRQLLRRGEHVHALCRASSDVSALHDQRVRIVHGEVTDPKAVEEGMKGCDRVYHLAGYARNWAKDKQTYHNVNVRGTETVLEVARRLGVRRIVVTSTELTFGPSNGIPVDETTVRSLQFFTEYERSKHEAEIVVVRYARQGLHAVIVNPTRVFGPGALTEGNSVTKMIDWYLSGKWRFILGNGTNVGNYGFVDDVVKGHILAMESGKPGEKYILGGENISFNQFFEALATVSNRKYRLVKIPSAVAFTVASFEAARGRWFNYHPLITPEWTRVFLADWQRSSAKAQRELGYVVTPFLESLEQTVTWLEQTRKA
ncbi:MAG: Dihydroflavonol-4-reductase [Bacteroidetes bacterium]|nr:Dihydroflavonol-4-reductase [Bacteroidota bacterium]